MFRHKAIRVQITLGKGAFPGTKDNTYVVDGLGVTVEVEKNGLPDMNKASISISNMMYEKMEQLTMLAFRPLHRARNVVSVFAGEEDQQLDCVFVGEITSAFADYTNAPDIEFQIQAKSGSYPLQMSAAPVSVNGQTSAASLIERFAKEMGYSFKNQGVTVQVRNSVFNGSPLDKAKAVAAQCGIDLLCDDGEIIILPRRAVRKANVVPLLTPESGLIGYPTFTEKGIKLNAFFNPAFKLKGLVRVESIVPKATGTWRITKLSHSLSAYRTDSEDWYSSIEGQWVTN